jgi:hypothetical protein
MQWVTLKRMLHRSHLQTRMLKLAAVIIAAIVLLPAASADPLAVTEP